MVAAVLGAWSNGGLGFIWFSLLLLGYATAVTLYIRSRYNQFLTKSLLQKNRYITHMVYFHLSRFVSHCTKFDSNCMYVEPETYIELSIGSWRRHYP